MILQIDPKSGEVVAVWETAAEAERNTEAFATNITKCLKGKRSAAGGFEWKFSEQVTSQSDVCATKYEAMKEGSDIREHSGVLYRTTRYEPSITSLEEAEQFFEVDTEKWKAERFIINSWDVTNAEGNRYTNYQTKVWIVEKDPPIIITDPQVQHLSFDLPKQGENQMWLVIGCVHRPFHNKRLWDGLLNLVHHNANDFTGVLINGDYLDLRSLSTHDDYVPEGIDLGIEYSDGLQGIAEIDEALGARQDRVDKVFHYGNHEDRYLRFIKRNPHLGTTVPSPIEALELEQRGYKVMDDWKDGYTMIGNDLEVYHGIYFNKNAAAKHVEMMPEMNGIFNHTHRVGSASNGRVTHHNIGWLGDVTSDGFKYADRFKKKQWQNAFAIVYVDHNGKSFVNTVECDDNGFFFGGKHY